MNNLITIPFILLIIKNKHKLAQQSNCQLIKMILFITKPHIRLSHLPFTMFSTKNINTPPAIYSDHRTQLKENGWRDIDPTHTKSATTHLSNGQLLIHKIPVIKSHSSVVRCMGGTTIGAGHPQVYIQLDTRKPGQAIPCKWCGLRYSLDLEHHH